MKRLKDILNNCNIITTRGSMDVPVSGISFDSRKTSIGELFVAVKGTLSDGHQYIYMAIEKGAEIIVCQEMPREINPGITYIQVKNSQAALGILASAFYDFPSEKLNLIGVTGTNGKTTVATLLYHLFENMGYKAGLFSTVKNYAHKKASDPTHTTPDPVQLNRQMKEMADMGCDYCFMEVSSHGIDQKRIAGLKFAGGIFTNLTHDHLDYHGDFAGYRDAKKLFFDELPGDAFALSNIDDKNGHVMLQNTMAKRKTYSLKTMGDFTCRIMESHFEGMMLNIENNEVWTKFLGTFNAYNLLAVYSTAVLSGIEKDMVLKELSKLEPVAGRFEVVRSKSGITAIVDYAHTPDALLNILKTIKGIVNPGKQLITVVGAGGNRDKAKRPVMAKIVLDYSDKVIFTSDNPRFEKPEDIIADMKKGVDQSVSRKTLTITDRKEAIKTACMMAGKGDIILVAGKGHETYQEIEGKRSHFDDKEIVSEQLDLLTS